MRRALILTGLFIFIWGANTGLKQINTIEQNIEYLNDHAPNINVRNSDQEETAADKNKKETGKRKEKEPEMIFEEADYLVKIRLFRKIVIPYTQQTIYLDAGGFGSGFTTNDKNICKKSAYCVVTAFHVVNDGSMSYFAESKNGSRAQMLELANGSKTYDFAVLRFIDYDYVPAKTAVLGKSSKLKPGARIYTMGSNAYGDFWFSPTGHLYTSVKAASPQLRAILAPAGLNHPELLLFHTPVFHGFSGGPLVNKYGEVVGISIGMVGLDEEPIYIGSPIDGIRKTLKNMK